jgi:hypothetical protein
MTDDLSPEDKAMLDDAKQDAYARQEANSFFTKSLHFFQGTVDQWLDSKKRDEQDKKRLRQEKKQEKENTIYTSLVLSDNFMAEQLYNGETVSFAIYDFANDAVLYQKGLEFQGITYKPINDEEVEKKAVLLPSKAEEYGTELELDAKILAFVHKWIDLPEESDQFCLWNIKRSWIYQRFHSLNYLRALGDFGTGKSRFLDVMAALHYKPIVTTGATTAAPVFRILEKWKGSFIMDEADLKDSDQTQDIIKLINQGYERGKFVLRCDQNDASKVLFFDAFSPKVLATRQEFKDKATESRCITILMTGTTRNDIPLNLNDAFFSEALELRNKLLMWRFRNYFKINPAVSYDFQGVEPRIAQIMSSFLPLFVNDAKQLERFKSVLQEHQDRVVAQRQDSFDGQIVKAIYELWNDATENISADDIIKKGDMTDYKTGLYLKPRALSSHLKSLGFGKTQLRRIGSEVKRCIPLEPDHLNKLFARFGFSNNVTKVTMYMGSGDTTNDTNTNPKNEGEGLPVTSVTTDTKLQG